MLFRNDEQRRVFFLTEKCASTSIREALMNEGGWERIQSTYPRDYGATPDGYTKFAVVRNPFPRVLSYWHYRTQANNETRTFREFVLNALDLAPITEWVGGHRDTLQVLRFERLREEWADHFNAGTLPHTNATKNKQHNHVASAYREAGEDVVGLIKQKYRDDFQTWYANGNAWMAGDG